MDPSRKKRKKKSFMQKAKKFGRQGRFGKGHDVDRETYDYFVQVLDNFNKDDFEDAESKELFVANVFASQEHAELQLCCNQLASRAIEQLLPLARPEVRFRLMGKLADDIRRYATNPFASHILEALLNLASFQPNQQDCDIRKAWVLKVAKYSVNNFNDFAADLYARHIIKTSFQCLSGRKLSKDLLRSKRSQGGATKGGKSTSDELVSVFAQSDVEDEVVSVFQLAGQKLEDVEDISAFCQAETSSSVVQTLLPILAEKDESRARRLVKLLVQSVLSPDTVFEFPGTARLLETVLQVSAHRPKMGKYFSKLSEDVFSGKLAELSQHAVANFAVQKLLQNCPTKDMFESWYESELDSELPSILGFSGVILAIGQTCRRLNAKQNHFIVALSKALECQDKPERLFASVLALSAADISSISLHGSLLVQEMLHFSKPIKVVSSILATDGDRLAQILGDPRGCHITKAFMASQTVGEKSRESLVRTLAGGWAGLACSKHGSISVDAVLKHASVRLREQLARSLVQSDTRLRADQYGKFVYSNLGLGLYKRSRDQWLASFDRKHKAVNLFSDILKPVKRTQDQLEPEPSVVSGAQPIPPRDGSNAASDHSEGSQPASKKSKTKKKSYLDDL